MPDIPKICFDRILPRDLMRPLRRTKGPDGNDRAISPLGKTWINGSTLRVRFMGGTPAQQATAREQARWWEEVANLAFDFGHAPDAEIRVTFDSGDGAWSMVGTDARQVPFNQATMNLGFLDGGTAGHEFGHAMGLAHEHSNPAGGIRWNEPVVLAALAGPPNFWDQATVRHNVFRKYAVDQINGTVFDPDSIMLYSFPASWTLNGVATHANDVLSALDKEFVAGAAMYPKEAPTPPSAMLLEVGGPKVTGAIGTAGEEDLYRFAVETDGVYDITTRGVTDVYMKLFGPDSETALVEEDDDSGYGLNARITAALLPGHYLVQIRHHSTSGVGSYTIRVKRR
jgi:Astacin (Peptidase family M12A)